MNENLSNNSDKRGVGRHYEAVAARYLKYLGLTVLERNYRCKRAEIDIIALDNDTLCFVEVKYRSSAAYGYPSEAVDIKKQQRIILASEHYLAENRLSGVSRRYDVVEIIGNKIRYLRNSFGGY